MSCSAILLECSATLKREMAAEEAAVVGAGCGHGSTQVQGTNYDVYTRLSDRSLSKVSRDEHTLKRLFFFFLQKHLRHRTTPNICPTRHRVAF